MHAEASVTSLTTKIVNQINAVLTSPCVLIRFDERSLFRANNKIELPDDKFQSTENMHI